MKKVFLLFFLLICLFNVCSCGKNNHEDTTDLNHILSNIKSYKYQVNYISNGTTLKKDYIYNLGKWGKRGK
jgi:outer membrane lipoprotein-sorting protein